MEKNREKLRIEEYSNGIILPRLEVSAGPRWGLGGVCDQNNQFVRTSFYDGGWATHGGAYAWDEEQYIAVDAVYIGMFFLHWGHFLVDLTNRMWALPELSQKYAGIKVAYIGEEEPKENHLRFFELLGIKKEQLLHVTKPTRFRKIYLPEQSFKSCEWYTDEFLKMLDGMIDNSLSGGTDFSRVQGLQKVYFTRRKFSKALSSEFGEEYFENIFVSNGFTSVAPESLSLDEQIYIWSHAQKIVCVNGTIPLNVMFARNKGLRLTVLNKTSIFHENPIILIKMREVEAEFVDIYMEPMKGYPKSLGEGPYLLKCTQEFLNYCQQEKLEVTHDPMKEYCVFLINEVRYYWAILGIKRKLRSAVSGMIPSRYKAILRRWRGIV